VRDKLVNGELDAAHVLYGLIYGVQMGIGGPKKDMAVLMNLNHNGQAITLSKKLADKGAVDGASLAKVMAPTSANTPSPRPSPPAPTRCGSTTGWRLRHQPDEGRQEHHRAAAADGGQHARGQHGRLLRRRTLEPPRHRRRHRHHGRHHPGHLEGPPREDARHHRRIREEIPQHRARRVAAVLEAGKWIDAGLQNKNKMAETIADKSYVNTSVDVINQRILGRYQNGLGKTWDDPNHMKFYNDGTVNFPYLSDGMWFMTQHKRWGLLKEHPDYLKVASSRSTRSASTSRPPPPGQDARAEGPDALDQADRRHRLGREGPEEVRRLFKIKAQRGLRRNAMVMSSTPRSKPPRRPRAPAAASPPPLPPWPEPAAPEAPHPPPSTARCCPARAAAAAGLRPAGAGVAGRRHDAATAASRRPAVTFKQARHVFSDPFYSKGPNDQGIGWNILSPRCSGWRWASAWPRRSASRSASLIGRFALPGADVQPLISLLRPVSPLAWLPIGLLVFKAANPAAIWTIFICSIWPMIINTAVGVQRVPQDYMNVARC
jgi:nitrate/nitrite transport system substrate-binding protein